ncbi:ABC transporter ATP-binding protein [Demequina activiva]|uniref:Iron ABC transporter ATP-binding protein n=1 Tax=Demequina activiva TaxID=1582364 RepID=A0A919Q397_9MICO|nr:ABC transporter ATP-binding protein [Demequina activiva]GIG54437.1 iron ABC transporter ATP-binding protein [Demequina activiva]
MTEVLRLDHVGLRRDGNAILSDITWTVHANERWVILGPNGAGKTSLLTIASARMHPSDGSATILGEELGHTDTQDLRTRVGLSSAALADRIPDDETVRDVVMTAAHGITGRWREDYEQIDEDRADALLAAFGMSGFAEREFWTLSEGERKRVQIGRALMTDPELLLLDEPAAGLDLGGREELLAALTELAGDHRSPAMVMVTHHVEEIPQGFTHAMLLREGEVVAQGPVRDTITASHLTQTYGMPVELHAFGGRWTARRG